MQCKHCGRQQAAEVIGANHVLHLLLSVCTGGLWLPIWFLCAITSSRPRCLTCGSK